MPSNGQRDKPKTFSASVKRLPDVLKTSFTRYQNVPVQGVVRFSKRQKDVLQTYWTSQVRHAGHVILAGNENIHNISDEFEIRPDRTKDCGVSCP